MTAWLALDQNFFSAVYSFKNNPRVKNRVVCGEANLDKVLHMKAASPSDRERELSRLVKERWHGALTVKT